jgi:hypothetical protein
VKRYNGHARLVDAIAASISRTIQASDAAAFRALRGEALPGDELALRRGLVSTSKVLEHLQSQKGAA